MRLARAKRMKNVGGTEDISRAPKVLFVAGRPCSQTAALQLAHLPDAWQAWTGGLLLS